MTTPQSPPQPSAVGQVFEFRLWAAIVEQSAGRLHVFLPLADRGVDALVHRISDGTYFCVQAKGRSSLRNGEVYLVVRSTALVDDDVLLIGGLIVEGGLGPVVLAAPVRDFKRLAEKTTVRGEVVYQMGFGMHPRSDSRWLPFLMPLESLVQRFGVTEKAGFEELVGEPLPSWRSDLGFHGESEVTLLLSACAGLNLFRPFPDLETCELAVLHRQNRRVVGLQIKTISVDGDHPREPVMVQASSFRPNPTTYFVVLAWLRDQNRFHEESLLIPSNDIRSVAQPKELKGHLAFDWHPGASSQPRLDVYRRELSRLALDVETILLGERTSRV